MRQGSRTAEPQSGSTANVSTDDLVPVLVVDDHPPNLDAIELVLNESGCRLVRAHSADEALLAVLEQDFAVIVLDIRMPDMNGIELADLIKTRPRLRYIPILFLTAHMLTDAEVLRAYAVGAVDYLTKPIRAEILRSKIRVFVDLFRKTRELARTNVALRREAEERARAEDALRRANQELEERVRERTDALERADRRKNQFLAVLGHELRNPLAPVLSALELLQPSGTSPARREQARAVIMRQVQQMTRLIDDLLDVGRITSDRLVLQMADVPAAEIVAAAIETSRPLIDEHGHELTVVLPEDELVLRADPARLSQVLANLLTNAAKFTLPGGRIDVSVETTDDGVVIRTRDTGVGIEAEVMPRLFELFGHVEHATGLGRGGLGIGLALARQLVAMHGGVLEGHSEGRGQGSEFRVRLPASVIVRARPEPALRTPGLTPPPVRRRVIVVDDNHDAADMLVMLLDAWGYEARQAYDGPGAVALADTFQPEVALLDLGLDNGPDGYGVAAQLRERPWAASLIIIAVTGRGQREDRDRTRAAGFHAHLVKPVMPDTLRDLLAALPRTGLETSLADESP